MVVVVGIGAGGSGEEEVGVSSKALRAGRGGDKWGGAVAAVEVEVDRNHHFHFHVFSLFLLMWKRSTSVENECLFWWDLWIYSERKVLNCDFEWDRERERKERGRSEKYWLCHLNEAAFGLHLQEYLLFFLTFIIVFPSFTFSLTPWPTLLRRFRPSFFFLLGYFHRGGLNLQCCFVFFTALIVFIGRW